jgi:hypothetical protein
MATDPQSARFVRPALEPPSLVTGPRQIFVSGAFPVVFPGTLPGVLKDLAQRNACVTLDLRSLNFVVVPEQV